VADAPSGASGGSGKKTSRAAGGTAQKVASKAVKATPQGRAAGAAQKAAKVAAPKAGAKAAPKAGAPRASTRSTGSTGSTGSTAGRALGKVGPRARKWLLAELVVCVLLLVLSGVTGTASDDAKDTGGRLAVKGSALAGVFVVLGLVSAGGKGAEKAAGALGALITLSYLFSERDAISAVSTWAKAAGK